MDIILLLAIVGATVAIWRQFEQLKRDRINPAERIEAVEKRINDLIARPPVVVASAPEGEAQRLLAALREAESDTRTELARLREQVAEVRRELSRAAAAGTVVPPSSEEVVRRWLSDEGYSSVVILRHETREDGERWLVSAVHGDQTRFGAILVRDLAVASASMSAPTFLFP